MSDHGRMSVGELSFERVADRQTGEVLAVLDEAAAWLAGRGVTQWPERFERSWVEPSIARGETWLVRDADEVVATLTLDWSDPVWADDGRASGYLHRMAVRRHGAGLGRRLLGWAAGMTHVSGREFLRLDCVAANRGLRAYYAAAGFAHRGDVAVGGPPGRRDPGGPITVVSRFERPATLDHELPVSI
jgi:hypothetical protein